MATVRQGSSVAGAHATPVGVREVTGFDGTLEEALANGLVTRAPPLIWNDWQAWRRIEGGAPSAAVDGPDRVLDHRAEGNLGAHVDLVGNHVARKRAHNP